jgi:tetratricopeptide (TPR) repeat protein
MRPGASPAVKPRQTLGLLFKLDEMKLPHFVSAPPTENLEAYDDYLRGVKSFSLSIFTLGTKDDAEKAQKLMEQAIELDPKYAEAYAYLGWIHMMAAWNQWSGKPFADLKQASALGQKVLALDDTGSSALSLLCESDWMQTRYDQAVADGERAVTSARLRLHSKLDGTGKGHLPARNLTAVTKT